MSPAAIATRGLRDQRFLCSNLALNVAIQIRAGERNDERCVRILSAPTSNRWTAASGMQRDQKTERLLVIFLGNRNLMAELFENLGPANRGHAVAVI